MFRIDSLFKPFIKQKCQMIACYSALNVRVCCCYLFYIIVHWLHLGLSCKLYTRRSHLATLSSKAVVVGLANLLFKLVHGLIIHGHYCSSLTMLNGASILWVPARSSSFGPQAWPYMTHTTVPSYCTCPTVHNKPNVTIVHSLLLALMKF